jgi:hypothetical protein
MFQDNKRHGLSGFTWDNIATTPPITCLSICHLSRPYTTMIPSPLWRLSLVKVELLWYMIGFNRVRIYLESLKTTCKGNIINKTYKQIHIGWSAHLRLVTWYIYESNNINMHILIEVEQKYSTMLLWTIQGKQEGRGHGI